MTENKETSKQVVAMFKASIDSPRRRAQEVERNTLQEALGLPCTRSQAGKILVMEAISSKIEDKKVFLDVVEASGTAPKSFIKDIREI